MMSEAERAVKRAAGVVARSAGVPVQQVLQPRGWKAKRLRHQALYLAVTAVGVRRYQVARAAGVDARLVERCVAMIEERRDDDRFDLLIGRLELKMGVAA